MRIYIVGPTCVGKTTLAGQLSKKLGIKNTDLDCIFIDFKKLKESKRFGYISPKEYEAKIDRLLKEQSWIIEGVYPVEKIFKSADVIVNIHRCLIKPLYWQWKRYFLDENQRKTFGFKNNLGLSMDIIRQYLGKDDTSRLDDPTYFSNKKLSVWLERYKNKVKGISELDLIK